MFQPENDRPPATCPLCGGDNHCDRIEDPVQRQKAVDLITSIQAKQDVDMTELMQLLSHTPAHTPQASKPGVDPNRS